MNTAIKYVLFFLMILASSSVLLGQLKSTLQLSGSVDPNTMVGLVDQSSTYEAISYFNTTTGVWFDYLESRPIGAKWAPMIRLKRGFKKPTGNTQINSDNPSNPNDLGLEVSYNQSLNETLLFSGTIGISTTSVATDDFLYINLRIQLSTDAGVTWQYIDANQEIQVSEYFLGRQAVPIIWEYTTVSTGDVLYRVVAYKSTLTNDGTTNVLRNGTVLSIVSY